jgi:hypothetical protein
MLPLLKELKKRMEAYPLLKGKTYPVTEYT